MPTSHKAFCTFGALTALALSACSGSTVPPVNGGAVQSAQATLPQGRGWTYAGGAIFHQPHYAAPRGRAPMGRYFHEPYLGGSVIIAPKYYFVFWGYKKYGDAHNVEPLLETYAKSMGGSGHSNIETQYYEQTGSTKTYITNAKHQYGGAWDDNSAVPKVPTDAQVATEALSGIKHFGFDPNGVYIVATPHNHSEADFPVHWCSYHSVTYFKKKQVPYIYMPYIPDGGAGCGANDVKPPKDESGVDEGVTIMAGHEFGETITDPIPGTAWYGPQGEIADVCAWHDIANDKFGRKTYTMQPMGSNADDACVQTYP